MAGVIFLIQGEKLVELREEKYDSEKLFQKLLEDYPKILAGDQINSDNPRKWLLISREMGVPDAENAQSRWSLDHFFIDQDGIPTFVEVKRSTDTRARREVVAQMLDYAANGTEYWKIPEIKVQFEQRCSGQGAAAEDVVRDALGPDAEYEKIWATVESNLKNGKIRLLFVADEIPQELRRIVEFLNEQMNDVEVLAVEVKQFTGSSLKTLVPRVIGQTTQAQINKTMSPAKYWDDTSFLDKIESAVGMPERNTIQDLLAWFKENNINVRYGKGSKYANCLVYILQKDGTEISPFSIGSDSTIAIRFDRLKNIPPFTDPEKRRALIAEIAAKIGTVRYPDSIDAWPSFLISHLNADEKRMEFKKIVSRVLNEFTR